MRVRFERDVRFAPPDEHRISIHYRAGMELTIRRAWGDVLVRNGYAVEVQPPSRKGRP